VKCQRCGVETGPVFGLCSRCVHAEDFIGGEAATRIMTEVMNDGNLVDATDTPLQAEYRQRIRKEMDEIYSEGGTVIFDKEW